MPPAPVSQLQRLVLEALRAGRPLPGGSHALTIPDRAFLPAGREIPVAPEHLEASLPAGYRLKDPDEPAYLCFRPADVTGDQICLTLEVRLGGRPLSGTRACFREDDGRWVTAADPVQFAT
jgi:hypothetical protein